MWIRNRNPTGYCLWCGHAFGRGERVWSNDRHEVFCCTRCANHWEASRERWTCPCCGRYDCPDCSAEHEYGTVPACTRGEKAA